MKIQSIAASTTRKTFAPNFKGFVKQLGTFKEYKINYDGAKQTRTETRINRKSLAYFQFSNDDPEMLQKLCDKFEYHNVEEKTLPKSNDIVRKIDECKIEVYKIPIPFETYLRYKMSLLSEKENQDIENILAQNDFKILFKKNSYSNDFSYDSVALKTWNKDKI